MMRISPAFSAVRFTDYDASTHDPSSELLGYYQSSAIADWMNHFCGKLKFAWRNRSLKVEL